MAEIIYDNRGDKRCEISVIIPAYNIEDCAKNCVSSLALQTFEDFECLFVDDGSTDKTVERLLDQKDRLSNLCIISQPNLHAGIARNTGMTYARGKYFIFLDGDDSFSPKLLQKLHEAITSQNADMALCDALVCNASTGKTYEADWILASAKLRGIKAFAPTDYPKSILRITCPAPWNKLISRELIEKYGLKFQDLNNSNDLSFSLKCLLSSGRIAVTTERLLSYTVERGKSLTFSGSYNRFPLDIVSALGELKSFMDKQGWFSKYHSSFYDLALRHIDTHLHRMNDPNAIARLLGEVLANGFFGIQNWPFTALRQTRRLRKILKYAHTPSVNIEVPSATHLIAEAFTHKHA